MRKIVLFLLLPAIIFCLSCVPDPATVDIKSAIPKSQPKPMPHKKVITNSLGMKFIYIKPGHFNMGSNDRSCNARKHVVSLTKGFYIQSTEVTQGQWKAVMSENPSYFKDCGDNCPVESVSWYEVLNFILALNQIEKGFRYRLPDEAEWEYACRGKNKANYCYGDDITMIGDYAWYSSNADEMPHPVATKKPNAWGLYDMHGNVREWCQDNFGYFTTHAVVDPRGTNRSPNRVVRGGSWFDNALECRSAFRYMILPEKKFSGMGFRLILIQ